MITIQHKTADLHGAMQNEPTHKMVVMGGGGKVDGGGGGGGRVTQLSFW